MLYKSLAFVVAPLAVTALGPGGAGVETYARKGSNPGLVLL